MRFTFKSYFTFLHERIYTFYHLFQLLNMYVMHFGLHLYSKKSLLVTIATITGITTTTTTNNNNISNTWHS